MTPAAARPQIPDHRDCESRRRDRRPWNPPLDTTPPRTAPQRLAELAQCVGVGPVLEHRAAMSTAHLARAARFPARGTLHTPRRLVAEPPLLVIHHKPGPSSDST